MTYAIVNAHALHVAELWYVAGDSLTAAELARPHCPACTHEDRCTLPFGAAGLIIDPTDIQIAALPDAELYRYGLVRATLDPDGRAAAAIHAAGAAAFFAIEDLDPDDGTDDGDYVI